MLKQLGKVGAIRREVHGRACTFCGGHTYQLVLRPNGPSQQTGLFARCTTCKQPRDFEEDLGSIVWM